MWVGTCNQCGLCCTRLVRDVPTRCEHLRILNDELTICTVFPERTKGMSIRLVNANGELVMISDCALPDYPEGLPAEFPLPGPCGFSWSMDTP